MTTKESLHGADGARPCPVRMFRDRDPFETAQLAEFDAVLQAFVEGSEIKTVVVDTPAEMNGDDLVLIDEEHHGRPSGG